MTTLYNAPAKIPGTCKTGDTAMRPFSSYAIRPRGVRFETQEKAETVELFLRQHPIVNMPWIIVSVILVGAPSILFPVLLGLLPFTVPVGHIIMGTAFWYLATFGFILTNFLHWFFNIYIVTNQRIVDIDFLYLLYKHLSVAELERIQDISFTSSGILATMLNYGSVRIQTAGELPDIQFELVPHPQKVVEQIRNLAEVHHKHI